MQSVWSNSEQDSANQYSGSLRGDIETDVLIVGGGMAGVLCAYRLKESGVQYVLAEARTVGSGITENTTAKITAQHGLVYSKIIDKYGAEKAHQYYAANMNAVDAYRKLSERLPCDFEEKTAYVYSMKDSKKLEKEAAAYEKLGIKYCFDKKPPLPFKTVGTLGMPVQAQFNPLKFLHGIAKGLNIYEHTFVSEIKDNKAITAHGTIRAEHIILATHFPLVNIPGLYFLKMFQHRSYVIALENAPDIGAMYVDECDTGHSFRTYKNLLLVGGGDHRTAKKGGGWKELRNLAKTAYPNSIEKYAWATQDCMTLDGMPYIGLHRKTNPSMYVATGFNKWGMTGAMVAAQVLTDLIVSGKSEFATVFSPQRSILHPQLFLNLLHAAGGWFSFGKRCPHMGCALKWNPHERTWDCSCHGSRFSEDGHIIDNPAKKGL